MEVAIGSSRPKGYLGAPVSAPVRLTIAAPNESLPPPFTRDPVTNNPRALTIPLPLNKGPGTMFVRNDTPSELWVAPWKVQTNWRGDRIEGLLELVGPPVYLAPSTLRAVTFRPLTAFERFRPGVALYLFSAPTADLASNVGVCNRPEGLTLFGKECVCLLDTADPQKRRLIPNRFQILSAPLPTPCPATRTAGFRPRRFIYRGPSQLPTPSQHARTAGFRPLRFVHRGPSHPLPSHLYRPQPPLYFHRALL
jgi:hypothetical protein